MWTSKNYKILEGNEKNMLKDNEITMTLGEYHTMRDKISEYHRLVGEIVRMC